MSGPGAFQNASNFGFRPQTLDLSLEEPALRFLANANPQNYNHLLHLPEPPVAINLGPLTLPVSCQKTRDLVILALAEVGLGPSFLLLVPISLAFVKALLTVNHELLVLCAALIGILGPSVAMDLTNCAPIDVVFKKIASSKPSGEPSPAKYAFLARYQSLSLLGGTEFAFRLYDLVGGSESYFAFVAVLVLVHSLTTALAIPNYENYDDEYLLHYRDKMSSNVENARQVLEAVNDRKPAARRGKQTMLPTPKNDQKVPRLAWNIPNEPLQLPETSPFSSNIPKNGLDSPYGLLHRPLDSGRLLNRSSTDSVVLGQEHDYDNSFLGSNHSLLMGLLGQTLRKSSHPGVYSSRFSSTSLLVHPTPQRDDTRNSSLSSLLLTSSDTRPIFNGVSTPPIHGNGFLDSQGSREPHLSANNTSIWSSSLPDLNQNSKLWDTGTPSKKKSLMTPTTFLVDEEISSPITRGSPLSVRSFDVSTENPTTAINSAKLPPSVMKRSVPENPLVLPATETTTSDERHPVPTDASVESNATVVSNPPFESRPSFEGTKPPGLLHSSSMVSVSSEEEFYDANSYSPAKVYTETKPRVEPFLPPLPTKKSSNMEKLAQKLKILTLTNRRPQQTKPSTSSVSIKPAEEPTVVKVSVPTFSPEPSNSPQYEELERKLNEDLAAISARTYSIPQLLLANQEPDSAENESKKPKEKVKESAKVSKEKEKEKEPTRSKNTVSKKEKLKGIPISKDKLVIVPPVKAEPRFPSPIIPELKAEPEAPKKEKKKLKTMGSSDSKTKSFDLPKSPDSAELLNEEFSSVRSLGEASDEFQSIIRDLDADLQKLSVRTGNVESEKSTNSRNTVNSASEETNAEKSLKKTPLQKTHIERAIEETPSEKSYVEEPIEAPTLKPSLLDPFVNDTVHQESSNQRSESWNPDTLEDQDPDFERALDDLASAFPAIPRSELRARILTTPSVEDLIDQLFAEEHGSEDAENETVFDKVVAEMSQLRDMFPDLDYELVDAAYLKFGGDLTLAAESLLSGEYPTEYGAGGSSREPKNTKKKFEKNLDRLVQMTGVSHENAEGVLGDNDGDFYAALVHVISTPSEPATMKMAQKVMKGVSSGGRVQGAYSKAISRTVEVPVDTYKFNASSDEAEELREIYYSNDQFKRMNEKFFQRALEFFAGDVFKVVDVATTLNECKDTELTFNPRFGYTPRLQIGEVSLEEKPISEAEATRRRNDAILLNLRSSERYEQMSEELRRKMTSTSDKRLKGYYLNMLRETRVGQRSAYSLEGSEEGINRLGQWKRGEKLDLHLLPVSAAMDTTKEALRLWWADELEKRIKDGRLDRFGYEAVFVSPLPIVTGRGIHSRGNSSPIRAAVRAYLEKEKYVYNELPGSFSVLGKKQVWG